jgi:hypothetical protein
VFNGDRNWAVMATLLLLAAVVATLCLGCGGDKTPSSWDEIPAGQDGSINTESDEVNGGGEAQTYGAEVVYMCGRSVLGGWFEHWGWDYDPDNLPRLGSFTLVYREMDVPPGIVDTAIEAAREAAANGSAWMFFKFCFEDFVGGDESEARRNLEVNKRIVSEIVEAAVEDEGLTLIIGNALPMVREYTDEWLVWNHREYNRFLEELAGAYGGRVLILDLYGALSTSDGYLRPEYAADPYDSHLNEAAYDRLDSELAGILR